MTLAAVAIPEIPDHAVLQNVGVHELEEARLREHLRRGHKEGAHLQREVCIIDRIAEERLHQRAGALRYDEGGQEPGRQRVRHRDAPRLSPEVRTRSGATNVFVNI